MSSGAGEAVGGLILLFFSCAIASAGGIGGGGLNVPILLVVFGFNYDVAVVLSQCTVLGNYIIQSTINFRKHHPIEKSRPLIYWDIVLTLLPAQIGGSNIGVILESVLPVTVLLVLSILVVTFAAIKTGKKGLYLWHKESQALLLSKEEQYDKEDGITTIQYPVMIFIVLAISWAIYAVLLVTGQTAVTICSPGFIVCLVLIYPLMIALVYWGINYVTWKQLEDPSSILEGDLAFKDMSFIPPAIAFIIGIMCSLLGIGGGELMGPLLLSYKVMPQVSTATTSMMSLITTCSNILHYAILGKINYSWGAAVFATGMLGGGTGRTVALYVANKYGRYSVLVFALLSVLIISLCLLIYDVSSESPDASLRIYC